MYPKNTLGGVDVPPNTIVPKGTTLPDNSTIGSNVTLQSSCVIGRGCRVGSHCTFGAGSTIGAKTFLGGQVSVGYRSTIGRSCQFGESANVGPHSFIHDNVTFGTGAIIGDYSTLGSLCQIGPRSRVCNNVTFGTKGIIRSFSQIGLAVRMSQGVRVDEGCQWLGMKVAAHVTLANIMGTTGLINIVSDGNGLVRMEFIGKGGKSYQISGADDLEVDPRLDELQVSVFSRRLALALAVEMSGVTHIMDKPTGKRTVKIVDTDAREVLMEHLKSGYNYITPVEQD